MEYEDFVIYKRGEARTSSLDPRHSDIISGIIRDGIKLYLKAAAPSEIGPLWQYYGRFCQVPLFDQGNDYTFCRRFDFAPKPLAGRRWVLKFPITTTAIDSRSFANYYESGDVWRLAQAIEDKRGTRVNRDDNPVSTQVLRYFNQPPHGMIIEVLQLLDEETVERMPR
jgi:hypothetical protein